MVAEAGACATAPTVTIVATSPAAAGDRPAPAAGAPAWPASWPAPDPEIGIGSAGPPPLLEARSVPARRPAERSMAPVAPRMRLVAEFVLTMTLVLHVCCLSGRKPRARSYSRSQNSFAESGRTWRDAGWAENAPGLAARPSRAPPVSEPRRMPLYGGQRSGARAGGPSPDDRLLLAPAKRWVSLADILAGHAIELGAARWRGDVHP